MRKNSLIRNEQVFRINICFKNAFNYSECCHFYSKSVIDYIKRFHRRENAKIEARIREIEEEIKRLEAEELEEQKI